MCGWCARAIARCLGGLRHVGGASATEFALALPVIALVLAGITEVGRMMYQGAALEKGVRAGALYAGRSEAPLTGDDLVAAANVVRTGAPDGSGAYLLPGWSDPAAEVRISLADYTLDGQTIPVVTVAAEVPFSPLMPGLAGLFGLDGYVLRMQHEQAHVGY